jgi:thiol-disulfide isomerase/thioredoxin
MSTLKSAPTTTLGSESEWLALAGEVQPANKNILALVELYASWCGPSTAIVGTLARLADTYAGRKLRFYQMDASLSTETQKYTETSKPHFLILRDGDLLEVIDGVNAPFIEKAVSDHIPDGMLDEEADVNLKGGDTEEN